ncbi:riboflavin synthase domain-like protein [Basidiobolus meristosporus CBS 931.73]|uniref:NADPH-dependent diflavin oxidoreductase 1 n=1 Tax=Basidiobolus meristosporus CBS 931.73 TaxID=1314790 RepID=A0A1Y1YTD7_9FUNG|nr:riboflavin synthase domain-like protein [Basidiobolus meristosporus CBS 931.73]|eukprot:ORY01302.1 riboflavin synthase domain-like protein [Basidiobolus meristosporus CBS 931.73]
MPHPPEARRLLVLYGSQTGCAQDVAERIGREGIRRHFSPEVSAMDDYDIENLINEKLVIFVCSTTGQGEEPDNMKKFWKFLLRKALPRDILEQLEYTVFGLGDSSYQKFNFPSKKLYKRLGQLGATGFFPRGDGDDQHYIGVDGTLNPWLQGMWETLLRKYPLSSGLEIIPQEVLLPPSYRIRFLDDVTEKPSVRLEPNFEFATLITNQRITSTEHFQDVRHLEMDVSQLSHQAYNPGDIADIIPKNLPEGVQAFMELMKWTDIADKPLIVEPNQPDRRVPVRLEGVQTLRSLFENHLDIYSVPRRSFIEMLSYFTTDENETEKLQEFCSTEGQDDFYAYAYRVKRTIFEVLEDFHSPKIDLDYLLDIFPLIRHRSFSISSSPTAHPSQIHLTVGIVQYKTKLQIARTGVCTKWLAQLDQGDRIPIRIAKGTMKLPAAPVPAIFIGPGTGIAPMRSFIEERVARGCTENYLFFGCRYSAMDYHYRAQWEEYAAKGQLKLYVAASRDQDDKMYVQHQLINQGAMIWDLIVNHEAVIFLSGNANRMQKDVNQAFVEIIQSHGNMSEAEATSYLNTLEKSRRFQQECWF